MIERLRREDLYEETLIVVTADHGEEFGEHGGLPGTLEHARRNATHPAGGQTTRGQACRPGPRDHLVTNVDMAPTLADYAGLDRPGEWDSESLRSVVENADADGWEHVVFDHGLYTTQRAIRTDRWKLVHTYDAGGWEIPGRQLFDMNDNPWEQGDVAREHPTIVDRLETMMVDWAETNVGRDGDELRAVARNKLRK